MQKAIRRYLFSLLLCLLLLTGCEKKATAPSSLTNVSFEDGLSGWTYSQYSSARGSTGETVSLPDAPDGAKVVCLTSPTANDLRVTQRVGVKKGHTYRFTALARVEGVKGASEGGACLAVMDTFLRSEYLAGDSDWSTLTLYFRATENEDIDLALRLGFFGSEQEGTVYFDKVSFEEVTAPPVNATVYDIEHIQKTSTDTTAAKDKVNDVLSSVVFRAILYAAATAAFLFFLRKKLPDRVSDKVFYVSLAAAFLLRAILAVNYRGFHVDVNCFSGWGQRMLTKGPFAFYEPGYFCDYPPVYMLVCGLQAFVAKLFGLSLGQGAGLLLLKLPAIVCDLLSAFLIFRIAKKHLGGSLPVFLGILYAFNPAAILNGAAWGQVDGILVFLILLSLYFLDTDRFGLSAVVWFIALFTKPQTVLFGPVMLFATVREFILIGSDFKNGQTKSAKKRLLFGFGSLLFGAVLFLLLTLTMANGQPFDWLIDKYFGTLGSYDYASLNAFSFMSLIGGQWVRSDTPTALGLSYASLGTLLVALTLVYAAFLFIKQSRREKGIVSSSSFWLYASLTVAGVVIFATRSHERYLFPVAALLLVAYTRTKDRRLLTLSAAAGILTYLNAAAVLYLYESTGEYLSGGSILLRFGSLAVVALYGCLAYVAYTHAAGTYQPPAEETGRKGQKAMAKKGPQTASAKIKKDKELSRLLLRRDFKLPRLSWKDAVICLVITAAYAALALTSLGNTRSAQTYWKSSPSETMTDKIYAESFDDADYVVVDFGEEKHIDRAYYFTGILPVDQTFYVSYSSDGVNWTQTEQVAKIGGLFYWRKLPSLPAGTETARYAAVSSKMNGLSLIEIGFFEKAGDTTPIPVKNVVSSRAGEHSGAAVFDEQSLVPDKPSYMNSMYFDEIYHARTGYETAHGMSIYEVSHPPLGKDFISLSIRTFGMTPFAWRFPGTMAGILMLPVLYFLGLLLFRRRPWATVLTLLMALDGMHFVQTRIATVDSFAVLFILLMFLFMFWYQSISFYDKPLWKTFVPLGLCGISFGLGAASKWIGIYAGAGLAVLFFVGLYRRYAEYCTAKRSLSSVKGNDKAYLQHVIDVFPKYAWLTVGFCVVFFVLIPFIIYLLSYIPYAKAQGETRSLLKVMWDNQQYMYHYHSTLKSTHPYQSDWYTWPLMKRPVWMYHTPELPNDMKGCISTFGNPAVWYSGLVCTLIAVGTFFVRLKRGGMTCPISVSAPQKNAFARFFDPGDSDVADRGTRDMETLLFLLIGTACNFLPWVGVGRCVFLYHYFATTPFIMLFTVWCLRDLARRKPETAGKVTVTLLALTVLLFIMFKPVWTGTPVSAAYITTYLKWFDSWYFSI